MDDPDLRLGDLTRKDGHEAGERVIWLDLLKTRSDRTV